MKTIKSLNVIFASLLIGYTCAQYQRDKERQIKDQLISRNYDPAILPSGTNETGPVVVNINVDIKNILDLDSATQTLKIQFLLKVEWQDSRLSYQAFPPNSGPESISLASSLMEKVWKPDIYFIDAIEEKIDTKNQFMNISLEKGDVAYSSIIILTTRCPVNLRPFPHDIQTCKVKMTSFASLSSDIAFHWSNNSAARLSTGTLESLSDFNIQSFETSYCNADKFSCIQLTIQFKRLWNYYLVHLYIPCTMLIIISWLSYFLHPMKSATPRLIVAVSVLGLALIGITHFNTQTPRVSYTKLIDFWTGISLTFIFTSLVEFIVVNFVIQYGCGHATNPRKSTPSVTTEQLENPDQQTPLNPENDNKLEENDQQQQLANGQKLAARIDCIFRIAIPILFKIFIVIYVLLILFF